MLDNFDYLFCDRIISYILEFDLQSDWRWSAFIFKPQPLWYIIIFILMFIIVALVIDKALMHQKITQLNKQLNKQAHDIIAAEKEIVNLKHGIEKEVLKRTAALGLANHDLQENSILMEKIAHLTPNILYIYDLERKVNLYANRFVGEILGYSNAEIEQINVQLFDKLLHPEDCNSIAKHHQKCLTLGKNDYLEVEYRMKDRFGQWHWLHSKDTIFERDETGKPTQILGITQDITETKKIEAQTAKLNLTLAEKIQTLETWHKARMKLGKMNEFLQTCLNIEEAKLVLSDLLPQLFPNTHGAVYLMNNSKNLLNAISVWGLPNSNSSFETHECWALRRNRTHLVNVDADVNLYNLYCNHVEHHSHNTPTLCLSMIAKGKTLGMLYLRFAHSATISKSIQELAETVAQNIAMSFANLTLQQELRYQSLRDPLTGLFNRRYLHESLIKEIERAQRKQQFIGIMMLDIDHFKRFNDTYGHSAGDLVIKEVANYLISEVRQYDIACRYGGEELVLVMPDASIEDTIVRAEQIRIGISELKLEHEDKILESVSVSIGVSCFPDDGTTVDSLINAADRALYEAKSAGRDCVRRS